MGSAARTGPEGAGNKDGDAGACGHGGAIAGRRADVKRWHECCRLSLPRVGRVAKLEPKALAELGGGVAVGVVCPETPPPRLARSLTLTSAPPSPRGGGRGGRGGTISTPRVPPTACHPGESRDHLSSGASITMDSPFRGNDTVDELATRPSPLAPAVPALSAILATTYPPPSHLPYIPSTSSARTAVDGERRERGR